MNIGGVELSSPDRIIYPGEGINKRAVAEYYVAAAKWMLPHVKERPLSLVRCPQGQGAPCFYQKHWAHAIPAGIGTVDVREESGEVKQYVHVEDVRGLVALVQYGVLEMHTWGARSDNIEAPDRVVFDLDPAPDVPWTRVKNTALELRELLTEAGLKSWVKTTGGKGLHLTVPIARRVTWDDVHDFVRLATARMISRHPDELLDTASKAKRQGKIFIDYLRNSRGATAVAPWSTRSREGAPVSVPLDWSQLKTLQGGDLVTIPDALRLFRTLKKDPWATMLTSRQQLTQKVLEFLIRG